MPSEVRKREGERGREETEGSGEVDEWERKKDTDGPHKHSC